MKTDSEIQKNVMDELKWEPILIASEIGVAVHHGVVSLNGYVSSYAKKFAAENAAWRVKGVRAVAEELQVQLADDDKLNDTEIAENVASTLKWHTSIPEEKIKIKVANGWVTLDGQVDWNFQRESVFIAVSHLKGVTGVTNLISVKPRIDTAVVKDNIRKALERSADMEAANIKVDALGNKVILKGHTKSWVERRAVENAAWSAPGVATVDDQLVISYN